MSTHNLEISNGHSIAEVEGQHFVLDTGCYWSFRYDKECSLNFGDYWHGFLRFSNLVSKFVRKKVLKKLTGKDVDGLIGMDFLANRSQIVFDTVHHEVRFHCGYDREAVSAPSQIIPFQMKHVLQLQPYISVPAESEKGSFSLLFDTGSFVNYLSPKFINKAKRVADVEDYSPDLGKIRTKAYEMDMTFGENTEKMAVAKAPLKLRFELMLMKCKGILSLCTFFEKYPIVVLDIDKSELQLFEC